MLLDIGSVLGGIGLAVAGFVVVILVCVVILRLLAAILPSYEDRTPSNAAGKSESERRDASDATGDAPASADEAVVAAHEGEPPA